MKFPHYLLSRAVTARLENITRLLVVSAGLVVFTPVQPTLLNATGTVYWIGDQEDFDALRAQHFEPGDTILFKRGEVFTGMFAPKGSGTAEARIRLGSYGEGPRPVIHGMGGENQAAVFLHNVEYWEVRGLEVTNTDGSEGEQGDLKGIYILIDDPMKEVMSGYLIEDCYVHSVNGKVEGKLKGGIHVHTYGDTPVRIDNLRILNNTVARVGGVGIGNASTFPRIEENQLEYLWTNVYVAGNFVTDTGRNCVIARVSKDAIYEYNVLANSSRYSTGHSIFNFTTDGIIIQNNEAYGNIGEGGIDRGGFDADWDASNTTFQYNYSHDNHWFMGIMRRYNKGVVIRYNISQNETHGLYFYGFRNANKVEDVHIYNNAHYISADLEHVLFNAEDREMIETTFSNNIFYFEGSGAWGPSATLGKGLKFENNVYFNIPVWPGEGGDPGAVTDDPLFVDPGKGGTRIDMADPDRLSGYRLKPGSPGIDAGVLIEGVSRDFWGNPVPVGKAPDIGVHETRF